MFKILEFSEVINLFRFFVDIRNYGYVDRIGNALSYEPVEYATLESLRAFRSIYESAKMDENHRRYIEDNKTNRKIYLPRIPSEDQVKTFLDAVKQNRGVARRVAMYALSFRPKGGES